MIKKLYLFRHGETDWNKESRVQCSIDTELNENGLNQAHINCKNLKDKGIECVYSSPLKRAYKTAEILAKGVGAKIEVVEGLKEMVGGDYEGLTKQEIISKFGKENYEMFSHTRNDGMELCYLNGETKKATRERIRHTVENICKNSPYNTIAIASHGFILREFIRSTDFENDVLLKNCEVLEAEYKNGEIAITKRIHFGE